MLKKVKNLNMGVFKNFSWDASFSSEYDFKKINIFYGRNYSGKTTLSRVMRILETHTLPKNFAGLSFEIELLNDAKSQNIKLISEKNFNQAENKINIRVFNTDFVKDNLSFISSDTGDIRAFAILGEENKELENKIEKLKAEVGDEKKINSLKYLLAENFKNYNAKNSKLLTCNGDLETSLTSKAREIKNEAELYGDVNYNKSKLESDLKKSKDEHKLTSDEIEKLKKTIKEENKPVLELISIGHFTLKYLLDFESVNNLLSQQITLSDSNQIKELLNDPKLSEWVKTGRELHLDRNKCAFCDSEIDLSIVLDRIDKHFNEESKNLSNNLKKYQNYLENELKQLKSQFDKTSKIDRSSFYTEFYAEVNEVKKEFEELLCKIESQKENLSSLLQKRIEDIFNNSISTSDLQKDDFQSNLTNLVNKFNAIIQNSNQHSKDLGKKQTEAKDKLRKDRVFRIKSDIDYLGKVKEIEDLTHQVDSLKDICDQDHKNLKQKENEITKLESQRHDESKAADRINELLNLHFGNKHLELKPYECSSSKQIKFKLYRGNEQAFNLSEGESSLIAFCYFIAKLEAFNDNVVNPELKPIIWIDDPISSLDSNHIFFIYSMIQSEIQKKQKYNQLLISTHNLEFLKYCHRIGSKDFKEKNGTKERVKSYYLIEKTGQEQSLICSMPQYMRDYVTEFNYLFEQIYKCADEGEVNHDVTYSFANNARKFIEIYSFYKLPHHNYHNKSFAEMIHSLGIFDNDIPAYLVERVDHEGSHLTSLERGMNIIEKSEIKQAAKWILSLIQKLDEKQYKALCESIGKPDLEKISQLMLDQSSDTKRVLTC
jgi:wobble nucleotide-excising tRNase